MKSSWKYQVLSLAVLAAMATAHRAEAQTVALGNGNSLTFNGLTYTISACAYTLAGVAQSSCGPAGAELEETGSGRSASIEVIDANPGTPLLSIASTAGNTSSAISFALAVSATSPASTITSLTDTLSGSGVAGYPTQVSAAVSETQTTPNANLTTSLTSLTDSASFAAYKPTTTGALNLSVDLAVSTMAGNHGTITLTSAALSAPEPTSMALLGTALIGLTTIGRRFKRSARPLKTAE